MSYTTIFIVDDNPTTSFYHLDVITDFSPESQIICYDNPDDFIKSYVSKFASGEGSMLLLLDINMPQKLGYELLEELDENVEDLEKLQVIMVTSSNLRMDMEKSSRFINVIGYIEKPLTIEKLNKALNGNFQIG